MSGLGHSCEAVEVLTLGAFIRMARISSSTEVRAWDISAFIEARVRDRSSVPYLCFFVLFLSGQIRVDPPEPSEDYEILVFSSDFTTVGQSISAE